MRRTFIASVLLSPLFLSAAALATPPATDASTFTPTRPLSTGVTQAHVVYAPNVTIPASAIVPSVTEFVLHMKVGEDGKTKNVEIIKSAYPELDGSVATAVRQFRFRPATLDNQPVATEMTLNLLVQR
jgi:TonB family protein